MRKDFLLPGEVDKPLIEIHGNDGDPSWLIEDDHSYADIARHFVRHDRVGAEELHRILGEMLNDG